MYDKSSIEYQSIKTFLGLSSSENPNIPRRLPDDLSPIINSLNTARNRYANALLDKEFTKIISLYRETSTENRGDNDHYSRCFLVNSMRPLTGYDVRNDLDIPISVMYGGKCQQKVEHFHYLVITEGLITRDNFVDNTLIITTCWTSSDEIKSYISNQKSFDTLRPNWTDFRNTIVHPDTYRYYEPTYEKNREALIKLHHTPEIRSTRTNVHPKIYLYYNTDTPSSNYHHAHTARTATYGLLHELRNTPSVYSLTISCAPVPADALPALVARLVALRTVREFHLLRRGRTWEEDIRHLRAQQVIPVGYIVHK